MEYATLSGVCGTGWHGSRDAARQLDDVVGRDLANRERKPGRGDPLAVRRGQSLEQRRGPHRPDDLDAARCAAAGIRTSRRRSSDGRSPWWSM